MRNNRDIVERVFTTGRPQYSSLFVGSAKKAQIVTVEVPVFRDGEVIYDISFTPADRDVPDTSSKASGRARDWTLSMLDAEGYVFARVPNPQETLWQARHRLDPDRSCCSDPRRCSRRCRSTACS